MGERGKFLRYVGDRKEEGRVLSSPSSANDGLSRCHIEIAQSDLGEGDPRRDTLGNGCTQSARPPNHQQNTHYLAWCPSQPHDISCFFRCSINMRACKANFNHLSLISNGVRKSIARVLTVINQKQRQNVRELYKSKNAKCTSTRFCLH
jgi:hypothetical protein